MPQPDDAAITSKVRIPQMAYMNAQVLHDAHARGLISESEQRVADSYGIPSYRVRNPAHVVSLLYCLIVVPKELWDPPANHQIYGRLEIHKPLDLFDIDHWDRSSNNHPIRDFIKHLRNAVAHANFDVCEDEDCYVFRDRGNFTVSISGENLGKFLSTVGAELANLWNTTK